ncbi:VOC family protein [Saccharothrix xinjiangensis]|uniref:VOC family protein n=1 Tax=Saccharothrix xinjiangensis TaxID=204798 RepID=A0ABV9XSH4_9PSEU
MLRGLTTINRYADDVAAARTWYAEMLGVGAHFARQDDDRPSCVEFRTGGFEHEFGIVDSRFAPHDTAAERGDPTTYRAVDDLDGNLRRLASPGAEVHREPAEHGPGFVTASVTDRFGNVLGLRYNERYLRVANERA